MTEKEISNALREHLASTSGRPSIILGENDPTPKQTPFWRSYFVKTPPRRTGIEPWHIHAGQFFVAVMVEEGTYTKKAEDFSELIVARFPANLILPAGDGEVQVTARPHASDGFNDGAYWRINVQIPYTAQT